MDVYIQLVRIVMASIIGVVIGMERSKRRKDAGIGTFSIICVTSCFLTLISIYGFENSGDPSRLVSNIINAIGFVAGGVIFTINKGGKVKVNGLTTGAEIFCVAALGIGVGLGLYALVIVTIILMELNIAIAVKFKKHYGKNFDENKIESIKRDSTEEDI